MKKVFLMFAVVGIIGLSSCSKEYTCTCSDGSTAEIEGKKSDAEDACDALQATSNVFSSGVTCSLD